jgi:hypothetical protein
VANKNLDTNIEVQIKRQQRADKLLDQKYKYHFVKSLFKPFKDDYKIVKTYDHYISKYHTTLSHYKITGSVNFINIHLN